MRERFYSRNIKISRSHVSIAGEFHLQKIAPRLISVKTIRFATDEILYRVGALIFSRSTFARSRVVFLRGGKKRRRKKRRVAFYTDPTGVTFSRFRLKEERKTRAGPRIRAKNVTENARAVVFYLATANFISALGEIGGSGRDYRGFLEAVGTAIAAATVAAVPLDGYTPDILPDNSRSGSHWSSPPFA